MEYPDRVRRAGMYMVAECPECRREVRVNLEHRLAFHGCAGSKWYVGSEAVRYLPFARRSTDKEEV